MNLPQKNPRRPSQYRCRADEGLGVGAMSDQIRILEEIFRRAFNTRRVLRLCCVHGASIHKAPSVSAEAHRLRLYRHCMTEGAMNGPVMMIQLAGRRPMVQVWTSPLRQVYGTAPGKDRTKWVLTRSVCTVRRWCAAPSVYKVDEWQNADCVATVRDFFE
ncbi:hypothetical protein BC628DRAFT_1027045 [Trametes gibbosa]|nr:hypothetical protein BC628DRAFT_1027045 [Trametes gibbosa]